MEAVSGSAKLEFLGPNKAVLYRWYFCSSLEKKIYCRHLASCTVRITAENFAGKFLITLE